jgi:hypothetical protein
VVPGKVYREKLRGRSLRDLGKSLALAFLVFAIVFAVGMAVTIRVRYGSIASSPIS